MSRRARLSVGLFDEFLPSPPGRQSRASFLSFVLPMAASPSWETSSLFFPPSSSVSAGFPLFGFPFAPSGFRLALDQGQKTFF